MGDSNTFYWFFLHKTVQRLISFLELFGVTLVNSVDIVCLPFEQDTIMCHDCILYYLEFSLQLKLETVINWCNNINYLA